MPPRDALLPPRPRREAFGLVLALTACAATWTWALTTAEHLSTQAATLEAMPDRFVEVILPAAPPARPPASSTAPAPEGERPRGPDARPETPEERESRRAQELQAKKEQLAKKSRLLTGIIGTRGESRSGQRVEDAFAEGDAGIQDLEGALLGVGGISVAGGGRPDAGIGDLAAASPASQASAQWRPVPEAEARGSERFTDHGVADMVRTEVDRLSTFGVDVDTASYTFARGRLREGDLPPAASVRVEEFVNYFSYDYVGPTGDAPFAVNMEAAPSPWSPRAHIMRVGVQGRRLGPADRRPLRLTFLVDVSGSMHRPDRIGYVRDSLDWLVDRLGPEDSVSIVTYAGRTEVLLEPTPVTRAGEIRGAISELRTGGGTDMGSGVELAYFLARAAYVPDAENRVVVLSDGDANVGARSHSALLELIEEHAGRGITLTALGFGTGNYNDALMEQLADQGDGNYHYVDSMDEARRIFGDRLGATMHTIARDVKLQVDFEPGAVHAWRLLGYENRDIADEDFRDDAVDAGEIGSGHQVTALYEVVLRDGYLDHPRRNLATVRLRAKRPGPDGPAGEWFTHFPARLVTPELPDTSQDFRVALSAATFAEKLRGSPHVEEVSWDSLVALLAQARRPDEPEDDELLQLVHTASRLAQAHTGI